MYFTINIDISPFLIIYVVNIDKILPLLQNDYMPAKTNNPKIITEEIKEDQSEEVVPKIEESTKIKEKTQDKDIAENHKITSFRNLDIKSEKSIETKIESDTNKETVEPIASDIINQEAKKVDNTEMSSDDVKNWLKEVRPDTNKEMEKSRKPFLKIFLIVLFICIILGMIIGGIYYYKTKVSKNINPNGDESNNITPSLSQSITPTSTSIDFLKYSLSILNGSGIAGEASKASKLLENGGFSKAKSGNAKTYDYTTTVISLKENIPNEVYEKLKSTLESTYIIEKSESFLNNDSEFDIEITVGNKKAS